MPRPNPRLAPVTSAVVPLTSLLDITILPECCGSRRRSFGGLLM
jgi:hypothetical protein